MSAFTHLPLGQRIPDRLHAVSCSLPTLRAVIGYEEKDPAVVGKMLSGYPRFVVHPLVRQLTQLVLRKHGLSGTTLWLTSSAAMAGETARYLRSSEVLPFAADRLHGVIHPSDAQELATQTKLFLQHVGGFLSSREAEDHLVRLNALPSAAPEAYFNGDAAAEVKRCLRPAFPAMADGDLFLGSSGMNAVYAAFRALSEEQAARGRTIWVQLGWLYLDTIAMLKKFAASPGDYVYVRDVLDRTGLEKLFAETGARIAGVLTEVPTNPLMQTPDVPRLADLCRRHGAALILDPSLVSPFDVDLLQHADVVTTSLTKYTASEGDVIAGFAAVNAASPHAAALRKKLPRLLEPIYARDLARLAAQIGQTQAVLAQVHANVPRVAAFLEKHPAIKEIFWARRAESRKNFGHVARAPEAVGAMISFSLRGPLEKFYDRVRLPKGPSFGLKTTIICPYLYLAHYDLVSTETGRAELAASGLDPNLLRLSVGTEPVEEIIAALDEALT